MPSDRIFGWVNREETVIRNVKDIATADRRALEHVMGRQLADDQRLLIRVVNVEVPQPEPGRAARAAGPLPEWCNVYQGLSDEAITSLEEIVLARADLSRTAE